MFLSDGAIANGSEPWRIPDVGTYAPIDPSFAKTGEPFQPYARDPETLARHSRSRAPRAGTPHRRTRGGQRLRQHLLRAQEPRPDGAVAPGQDRRNHRSRPRVDDPTGDAELLLVGWGSYGPIGEACRRARREGIKVAHAHMRHLNPFPANLGEVLRRYRRSCCRR